jgi:hypothetical protein
MKLLLKGIETMTFVGVLLLFRQSSNGHLYLLTNVDVSFFAYFPDTGIIYYVFGCMYELVTCNI